MAKQTVESWSEVRGIKRSFENLDDLEIQQIKISGNYEIEGDLELGEDGEIPLDQVDWSKQSYKNVHVGDGTISLNTSPQPGEEFQVEDESDALSAIQNLTEGDQIVRREEGFQYMRSGNVEFEVEYGL